MKKEFRLCHQMISLAGVALLVMLPAIVIGVTSCGNDSTTTSTLPPSSSGQTFISQTVSAGFVIGDQIRINPGGSTQEDATITGFGSFVLAAPTQFAHGAGEPVNKLAATPGPTPAPMSSLSPSPTSSPST